MEEDEPITQSESKNQQNVKAKSTSNTLVKSELTKGLTTDPELAKRPTKAQLAKVTTGLSELAKALTNWSTPEGEVYLKMMQENCHNGSPQQNPYNDGSTNVDQTPELIEESESTKSAPRRSGQD